MKILHLTLKKKWFDMIASGGKKEEYREMKTHWIDRLAITFVAQHNEDGRKYIFEPKQFDVVRFRNGYNKNAPTVDVECKGIKIATGFGDLGAEPFEEYFVIQLGEIIKPVE